MRVTTGPTVTGAVTVGDGIFGARFKKNQDGKGYRGDIQTVSPAVNGNFVGIRVRNPAASGKTVYVMVCVASSSAAVRFEIDGPVTPADAALALNAGIQPQKAGQAAGVATVTYANNLVGQVVAFPAPVSIVANDSKMIELGNILPADSSMDFQFSGVLAANVYSFLIDWYEE